MRNPQSSSKPSNDIVSQVAERIRASDNVLVTLSKDPSVDELSAALGLTFILDKLGKHATAIFSGAVPNAIEFLEPEKTFETNTNSLQDFIIALDKEKADHLRYKIDGDFVKVFITPYKTTIDESDMEFSHGDYNVDLVIALDVASSSDLDAALTEYGRIMHDASSINISAAAPGHFGDLEWGDPGASSVSEMICVLANHIKEKDKDVYDKPTATALLAGIVAATNRFSNERTSADTMSIASRLMAAGADQQLISSSIPVDILTHNTIDASTDADVDANADQDASDQSTSDSAKASDKNDSKQPAPTPPAEPEDPTMLEIHHGAVDYDPEKGIQDDVSEEEESAPSQDNASSDDAATPDNTASSGKSADSSTSESSSTPAAATAALDAIIKKPSGLSGSGPLMAELENQSASVASSAKRNLTPLSTASLPPTPPKDYASLMNAELQAAVTASTAPAPEASIAPVAPAVTSTPAPEEVAVLETPAASEAPTAPAAPETPTATVDNSPEYVAPLPLPSAETILPPPPSPFSPDAAPQAPETPTAAAFADDLMASATMPPATPAPEAAPAPEATVLETPAPEASAAAAPSADPAGSAVLPEQVYPADPSAFRIPGT